MIHLHDLTHTDIGRWVVRASVGSRYITLEQGRIKGWNQQFVFVVYKCDGHWDRYWEYTGAATNPEELEFVE